MPELPGRPVLTQASLLGDQAERADDIVRAQRRADPGREDQAVLLPQVTGHVPVSFLLLPLLAQRLHATPRQRQSPPGFLGLGVAALALRAPDVDREAAFARPGRIESSASDRLPSGEPYPF
ncbi:MAG TPA: hypothetical protein VFD73_15660 [Gemmatimonadales bacterium]|nr:hypothetical protein [Gemmatimonadales bacterium]